MSDTDVENLDLYVDYEHCNLNCPSASYLLLSYEDDYSVNTVTESSCDSCYNPSGADGCTRCNGPGADECLLCNQGYYLDRGAANTQLHGTCKQKAGSGSGEWFLTATPYDGYKDGS